MTEDDWDATDQGRAVNNFMKYTLSLAMVYVGASAGTWLPWLLRLVANSTIDNPELWQKMGAHPETLNNIHADAKYLRMLDAEHDEAVRNSLPVIGACSAIEGYIEEFARAIIRDDPSILDGTDYSEGIVRQKHPTAAGIDELREKQWRRIENRAPDREAPYVERFEAMLALINRADTVPQVIQDKFNTAYAIRNVWAHNAGYADANFLAKAPAAGYGLGELVAMKGKQSGEYLSAVMIYGMIVGNRERSVHGLAAIPLTGRPAGGDLGKAYNSLYWPTQEA